MFKKTKPAKVYITSSMYELVFDGGTTLYKSDKARSIYIPKDDDGNSLNIDFDTEENYRNFLSQAFQTDLNIEDGLL